MPLLALEIAAVLPALFWLALLLDARRRWPRECFLRREPRLEPAGGGEAALGDAVLAVVPARNEAETLAITLPALLRQLRPPLPAEGSLRGGKAGTPGGGPGIPGTDAGSGGGAAGTGGDLDGIIVVDDRSDDGTAAAARRIASEGGAGGRLRAIAAPPTPAGWSGKVHALAAGVEESRRWMPPDGPAWLLFTDADIVHPPDSVRALLLEARRGPRDLVSVMARLRADGFWERVLVPAFVFFFHLIYPFRMVNRPGSRTAAAAGGCILIRTSALRAAGGLEAIRGALIDDVALARAVQGSGGRLWLGFDAGIESIREYRNLGEIWRMISRCAFTQLRWRYEALVPVVLGLGWFFAAPPAILVLSAALLLQGAGSGAQIAAAAAGLAVLLQAAALLPFVRHHRAPPACSALLPLAAVLYALMTCSSAWNHLRGKGSSWKGRRYGEAGIAPRDG